MTVPEVDYAQRLGDSLDAFLTAHRADLGAMMCALDTDVDMLIMDMLMAGYEEMQSRAVMLMTHDGKDYAALVDEFKELVE